MKARVTLSLDAVTVAYLNREAKEHAGGNMSAYTDRLLRQLILADAARRCDEYDRTAPDRDDMAEWDAANAADQAVRWAGAEW
jgi:hypothetical protein